MRVATACLVRREMKIAREERKTQISLNIFLQQPLFLLSKISELCTPLPFRSTPKQNSRIDKPKRIILARKRLGPTLLFRSKAKHNPRINKLKRIILVRTLGKIRLCNPHDFAFANVVANHGHKHSFRTCKEQN